MVPRPLMSLWVTGSVGKTQFSWQKRCSYVKVETGGGSNPHLTFQLLQVGATQPAVLFPVLVEEILDGQGSHQLDTKQSVRK
jgi:hypothetical protein